MSLSNEQLRVLTIVGRCASTLSILGVATIIGTFSFSRHFRNPIQRIMFINAFYNLFDFIATMISLSGPNAGNDSALCQFQAFSLQMFPLADVFWTFATAWNVFLTVFYQYDAVALRKLEKMYIGVITALVFIPAVTFLFIHTSERGPMYSSVTVWCSISPKWVLFRILFYYGPIWLTIVAIMILYSIIGLQIFKLEGKFEVLSNNHIPLGSTYNVESHQPNNSIAANTVEVNAKSQSSHIAERRDTEQLSIDHTADPRPHPSNSLNLKLPKQSPISFRNYILMPLVFFIVLLATWVPLTINRVYAFIDPGHVSYPLLLSVGMMGSLRGFWNGILFTTIGMKGRKRERRLEKRLSTTKASETTLLNSI